MSKQIEETIDYKGHKIEIIQDEDAESPDVWGNEDLFLVYDHRDFNVERKGIIPREIHQYLTYPPKPKKEKFGFIENNTFNGEPSEFTLEGGKEAYEEALEEWENNKDFSDYSDYFIFPVDAYIHSGVNLSLANTVNYPDRRWDVSTTGYVLVKKDILKDSSKHEEDLTEEEANKYAESLIKEWNQYLSGDVYGYKISKIRDLAEEISISLVKSFNEKGFNNISKETIKESLDLQLIKDLEEFEEKDSCWGFYGKEFAIEEAKSIIDNYDRI